MPEALGPPEGTGLTYSGIQRHHLTHLKSRKTFAQHQHINDAPSGCWAVARADTSRTQLSFTKEKEQLNQRPKK